MWKLPDTNTHAQYDRAFPGREYRHDADASGDLSAYNQAAHHDYNYDGIIRGAERRAEPGLYPSPSASSPLLSLDTLMPAALPLHENPSPFARNTLSPAYYREHFDDIERQLFEHFVDKPDQWIPITELMELIDWTHKLTQAKITAINHKLQAAGASKILSLHTNIQGNSTDNRVYLMQPAQPQVEIETSDYQLMRRTFCSKDHFGQLHEIALRDEEYLVLKTIIDEGAPGATKDELEDVLFPNIAKPNRDGSHLGLLVTRINKHLKHSTLSIANRHSRCRPALYVLQMSAPEQ